MVSKGVFIASASSVGAVGLGGYAVYSYTKVDDKQVEIISYRSKLGSALLDLSGINHQSNWGKRLDSLKRVSDETTLVEGLKALKRKTSPEATWQEVQSWCKENIDGEFSDENELKFRNLRTYCVFSISEKIPNAIASNVSHSDSKWTTALSSFNTYSGKLSSEFKSLKDSADKNSEKLHALCVKYYDIPFLSEEDEEFKSVKGVCVSS